MKRILSAVTAAILIMTSMPSIYAAETIDYTEELSELKTLMQKCEAKGISTDYEMVNYKTIERFVGYINEDLSWGHEGVEYNKACMQELYTEAKSNLEGYLDGTKEAFNVTRPNMNNLKVNGSAVYDDKGPVFSIGYGHFSTAYNDIPNFSDFGTNNIQTEIGPNAVMTKDSNGNWNFTGSVWEIKKILANAEEHNVGVSLLISPHYMVEGLSADAYNTSSNGFNKFNVDHPEVEEVLQKYIAGLIPQLKGYKSLSNICISNEPQYRTKDYADFYNPRFQSYLEDKHKTIDKLNAEYGTSYKAFSEINMPENWTTDHEPEPVDYDWMEFNDKVFADWHGRLTEWVKTALSDAGMSNIPVHSKMMGYFHDSNWTQNNSYRYSRMEIGTDLEMFGAYTDIAGNDTWDYITDESGYWRSMFLYDYQLSAVGKPVYNSEDHIIPDRGQNFDTNNRKHIVNSMWMGAAHGRSLSTIWIWGRSPLTKGTDGNIDFDKVKKSDFYNSILYRPDCVAAVGKTSLNLNRLNKEMNKIQQAKPKIALFYSKASRLGDWHTMKRIVDTYTAIVNNGMKVGVVSTKSLDKLSEYEALIVPGAIYETDEAYEAVLNFAKNGGKVIYSDNSFSKDEYGNARDNSEFTKMATEFSTTSGLKDSVGKFISDCGLDEVIVADSDGNVPDKLDWSYTVDDTGILINIADIKYDDTKKLSVYYNGEKLEGMTELISGETDINEVELEGYTPQLLSYEFKAAPNVEIMNISNDEAGDMLNWTYSSEVNKGAKIYSIASDGSLTLEGKTTENFFAYPAKGTYIVRALRNVGESKGKIISVADDTALGLSAERFNVDNGAAACTVTVKNNSSGFVTGAIAIKAIKADGSAVIPVCNKITFSPSEELTLRMSAGIPSDTVKVELVAIDSVLSKNALSNSIEKDVVSSAKATSEASVQSVENVTHSETTETKTAETV